MPVFLVFAQQDRASLDIAALARQASQFFSTKLEVSGDGNSRDVRAETSAYAKIGGEQRLCVGRPAESDDLAAAERAEARAGYTGLSLLARRCRTVWLIRTEHEDDRIALQIAAIMASVFLGPILSPDGTELFGVRTARAKLG